MTRKDLIPSERQISGKGQLLVFESKDGHIKFDVRIELE